MRAPEVNFGNGRLLDELGADVGVLPGRRGERPASHPLFPARVIETVADLKLHRKQTEPRRLTT